MAHITKRLQEAFIHQGKYELEGYLYYLTGSNWFNIRHLSGIGGYLKVSITQKEADGEKQHFEDIVQYLTLRQTQFIIPQPTLKAHEWTTELEAFKTFHNIEMQNFKNLEALFNVCREEKDFDSERFVGRLLEEQVKSVDEWEGNVEKVKSFSAIPGLIWHLDSIIG